MVPLFGLVTYGASSGAAGLGWVWGFCVGKTSLILAPFVVGFAVCLLAFWFGRLWERAGRRYASQFIDPGLYGELVELVRRVLAPTDVDQVCFLPDEVAKRARRLVERADKDAAERARVELRRRY